LWFYYDAARHADSAVCVSAARESRYLLIAPRPAHTVSCRAHPTPSLENPFPVAQAAGQNVSVSRQDIRRAVRMLFL